ncbi:hypothetical protein LBMAG03_08910 [Actinomycetes bacterium]|nr:hypothetical protein LBMAG03_08910 [Actinomycetes bacterium]
MLGWRRQLSPVPGYSSLAGVRGGLASYEQRAVVTFDPHCAPTELTRNCVNVPRTLRFNAAL